MKVFPKVKKPGANHPVTGERDIKAQVHETLPSIQENTAVIIVIIEDRLE